MQERQRHALGKPRVGPFPKLSIFRCFYGFSRFRRTHRACRCRCHGERGGPMGGGDAGTNGCAVGGEALGVSGSQKPKFSSIWVEKRTRNGSRTARETAEYRPRSRPALLLEVINDRGESHCHRTRHRGGRALPVPGCPQGRFPRRSTFKAYYFPGFYYLFEISRTIMIYGTCTAYCIQLCYSACTNTFVKLYRAGPNCGPTLGL
jgi:hypothetical protein